MSDRNGVMNWVKQGLIFEPGGMHGWMNSHAQIPTVFVMADRFRVYFATRPRNDLTLTTFVDLDKQDPKKVLYVHDRPVLETGRYGMFDGHGIMPNHVMRMGDEVWLYYVGWYRGSTIPYHNAIGLAVSRDEGVTFEKMFEAPVLDRTPTEPFSMGSIYVLEEGGLYHMFYTYVFDWLVVNGKQEPIYHIRHATSSDGVSWTKTGRVIIDQKHPGEAIARPSIIRKGGRWHMWFCYRGSEDFRGGADSYRIGYASSENLLDWHRDDSRAGIDVSESGWDSEMVTYPCIVEDGGRHIMFYNGNRFGTTGFGYAIGSEGAAR
jgi:predicted GH43/DUF377 family glycosyl hydrolase